MGSNRCWIINPDWTSTSPDDRKPYQKTKPTKINPIVGQITHFRAQTSIFASKPKSDLPRVAYIMYMSISNHIL